MSILSIVNTLTKTNTKPVEDNMNLVKAALVAGYNLHVDKDGKIEGEKKQQFSIVLSGTKQEGNQEKLNISFTHDGIRCAIKITAPTMEQVLTAINVLDQGGLFEEEKQEAQEQEINGLFEEEKQEVAADDDNLSI